MSVGLALDSILKVCWRVFLGMLVALLASGCSVFQTPGLVNDLAKELRETNAKVLGITMKIEKTIDDPEGFVDKAVSGAVKGGLRSISAALEESAEASEKTNEEILQLQAKDIELAKRGASIAGAVVGLPPGPTGQAIDIGLALLGLHAYRNRTRKKELSAHNA